MNYMKQEYKLNATSLDFNHLQMDGLLVAWAWVYFVTGPFP